VFIRYISITPCIRYFTSSRFIFSPQHIVLRKDRRIEAPGIGIMAPKQLLLQLLAIKCVRGWNIATENDRQANGGDHKILRMHHDMAAIKRTWKQKTYGCLPHNGVENMAREDGEMYFRSRDVNTRKDFLYIDLLSVSLCADRNHWYVKQEKWPFQSAGASASDREDGTWVRVTIIPRYKYVITSPFLGTGLNVMFPNHMAL
jgi:hypothetical protein